MCHGSGLNEGDPLIVVPGQVDTDGFADVEELGALTIDGRGASPCSGTGIWNRFRLPIVQGPGRRPRQITSRSATAGSEWYRRARAPVALRPGVVAGFRSPRYF